MKRKVLLAVALMALAMPTVSTRAQMSSAAMLDPDTCSTFAVKCYDLCRRVGDSMWECAIFAVSIEGWCLLLPE
jgi:hypothetical protein